MYQGLGLGLSLAKQTANLMGGDIVLESSGKEGSCFSLNLPLTTLQDQTLPTKQSFLSAKCTYC